MNFRESNLGAEAEVRKLGVEYGGSYRTLLSDVDMWF